jgi:hypothetical protein
VAAEIAQSVEHRTENPSVPGSNPGLGTISNQRSYSKAVTPFFHCETPTGCTKGGRTYRFFDVFLLDRKARNVYIARRIETIIFFCKKFLKKSTGCLTGWWV